MIITTPNDDGTPTTSAFSLPTGMSFKSCTTAVDRTTAWFDDIRSKLTPRARKMFDKCCRRHAYHTFRKRQKALRRMCRFVDRKL